MAIQNFALGSSSIDQIWYDSVNEIMWLKFRKVKEYPKYRFEGVPQTVIVELLNSHSAGSVYHNKIKGNYHSSSIEGPNEDETRNLMFNLTR